MKHRLGTLAAGALLAALSGADSPCTAQSSGPERCGNGPGGLQVVTADGVTGLVFPLKHTSVAAEVSGSVNRVQVTQVFENPYEETLEAIYVFPLPHEAAVDDFEMKLGKRTIRGVIERREEARRIYEQARASGHVAALLEQERPNIFTQSVANILPGNEIRITITYVETLSYDSGTWELAFPMVVGPRFVPPGTPDAIVPASSGLGFPPPSVPDGDRINPPFLPPDVRSGHDIDVTVRLEAGARLQRVESPTHAVHVRHTGEGKAEVELSALDSVPNKDFVLRWTPATKGPQASVLTHHDGEEGYLTVQILPDMDAKASEITPKEMIFVLDCSGSMRGEPMAAAKALVRRALTNMNASDSFQVIRFSTNASGLSPVPLEGSPGNVKRGLAYLDRLSGSGGTHMIEGIRAALDMPGDPGKLRIVMFLTDGYIGNENEILAAVRERIADARLFSFGVGSSVNRFLLERLAEEGRGEAQYALPGGNAQAAVDRFYRRIRHPYLTDVQLEWSGVEVADVYPARVPDLFQGQPLDVRSRYAEGGSGWLTVRGRIAGRPWSQRVRVDLPSAATGNPAIGSLWARARIADLERAMVNGEQRALVDEITRLGLRHRLVTNYTSFVAVEEKLVVSDGKPKTVRVPVEMPEGVSHEGIFGPDGPASRAFASASGAVGRAPQAKHAGGPGSAVMDALGLFMAAPMAPPPGEATLSSPAEPELAKRPAREEAARVDGDPLVVRIEPAHDRWTVGEPIEIRVTFTNRGGKDVRLPDATALRFRLVDASWRETVVSAEAPRGTGPGALRAGELLGAGESVTRTVRLNPAAVSGLERAGCVHLILDGTPLGAGDSNRITVEIVLR